MLSISGVSLLLAAAAWAQVPSTADYRPAVPNGSTYNAYGGGYGYNTGGGTVAGSAMQGMASVISARGDYNLSTSAAAINATVAERNEIQNRQMATDAYFQMRAANRAYQQAERGPKPTQEQLVRMAAEGVPKPVSAQSLNPVNGKILWPDLLQAPAFADQRAILEPLLAKRAAYGSLGLNDMAAAGEALQTMAATLKTQITKLPPQLYMESRTFLNSLMFSLTNTQL